MRGRFQSQKLCKRKNNDASVQNSGLKTYSKKNKYYLYILKIPPLPTKFQWRGLNFFHQKHNMTDIFTPLIIWSLHFKICSKHQAWRELRGKKHFLRARNFLGAPEQRPKSKQQVGNIVDSTCCSHMNEKVLINKFYAKKLGIKKRWVDDVCKITKAMSP